MSECVVSLCTFVYVYLCVCVRACASMCMHAFLCVYISVLSHRPKSNGLIIRCDIKMTTNLSMKRM